MFLGLQILLYQDIYNKFSSKCEICMYTCLYTDANLKLFSIGWHLYCDFKYMLQNFLQTEYGERIETYHFNLCGFVCVNAFTNNYSALSIILPKPSKQKGDFSSCLAPGMCLKGPLQKCMFCVTHYFMFLLFCEYHSESTEV